MKKLAGILTTLLVLLGSSVIASTLGANLIESVGIGLFVMEVSLFASRQLKGDISFGATCGLLDQDISLDCTNPIQAGTRDKLWIINLDDLNGVTTNVTTGVVEGITLNSGAQAYVVDGQNNSIEPKATMVEQGYLNMFDHEVMFKGFNVSPAVKKAMNEIKDGRFVAIVENYHRGNGGDAAFEIYGLTTGLEVTELERDPNSEDTQGAFHVKLFTKKNKEPKLPTTFFLTDYATTKAIVEALES